MTNPPVWLGTTELAYFQVNSTPGSCQHPSRWLRQAGWRAAGPPVPSRPASPPISALKRSMSRLGSATSWRGRGGEAGPAPDVRRHAKQSHYTWTEIGLISTLLAKWLRQEDAMHEVLGSNLTRATFLPFWDLCIDIWNCTFHVCTLYIHCINTF